MLLTINCPILVNKAFTNVRKTGRAEDGEIHSLFCEMVINWMLKRKTRLTKSQQGDVIRGVGEVFMDKHLVDPDLFPS